MAQISIYFNAQSSQGVNKYSAEEIKKLFFRHELTIRTPSSVEDLNAQLSSDVSSGVDYIFSVGGDGTANTIAQHLLDKKTKLLVIPSGTANDFAHEIGTIGNLKKISKIFNHQTSRQIDAININGRAMISNGGVGIASEVAKSVNSYRKRYPQFKKLMKLIGKETYTLIFVKEVLGSSFQPRPLFIESPDLPLMDPRVVSPLILINNQEYIAGKFQVAPGTKNNDGKFNVTIFLHKNKADFLKSTFKMAQGRFPHDDKNLIHFETNSIIINSLDGKSLDFFGDGESLASEQIIQASIIPGALNVCTYQNNTLHCGGYSLDQIEHIQ